MNKPELTIGVPCYDDFDGTYFTIQALRMFHADVMDRCELIVVDNHPESPAGDMIKGLLTDWRREGERLRYEPMASPVGPAGAKNRVFQLAAADAVLCMDSHVLLPAGVLGELLRYYKQHPDTSDLLSGPMLDDKLNVYTTHFDDVWRGDMWGIWGRDERGVDSEGPAFEIPATGMGMFSCRRDAWLGFNDNFRGFGGEEFYIHTKFRQAGHRCLCLPFLRWMHRFARPNGVAYPLQQFDKVRNYVIGHRELGLPLDRVHRHFVLGEGEVCPDGSPAEAATVRIKPSEWNKMIVNPIPAPPPPEPSSAGCQPCDDEPPYKTLDDAYHLAAETVSDINQHIPKLRELAAQCESVTELGNRQGVSTTALLAGQPKRFDTYDVRYSKAVQHLVAVRGETAMQMHVADALTVDIDETDMLFIDTQHTAEQLTAELARHAGKVRRWIVLHDTHIFGERGEGGGPGLLPALRHFMREKTEWSVISHTIVNHGLTVIGRLPKDKPKLPGTIKIGANFAKALAAHVVDGAQKSEPAVFEHRLQQCELCDQRNGDRCAVCGCFIAKKAEWKEQVCSLGKWNNAF